MNQNKGMTLLAHGRKSERVKEACYYGPACTRKDCIYDHSAHHPEFQKSNDPCMAFLAGQCLFDAQTCRKRHPPAAECDMLRAKYAKTRCRFGDDCQTVGCLYNHDTSTFSTNNPCKTAPRNSNYSNDNAPPPLHEAAFPPLLGQKDRTAEDGHGESGPPDTATAGAGAGYVPQQPTMSQPQPQQQPPQPAMTTTRMTPQQRMMIMMQQQQQRQQRQQPQQGWIPTPPGINQAAARPLFPPGAAAAPMLVKPGGIAPPPPPANNNAATRNDDSLNIHAKEFVPGGGK